MAGKIPLPWNVFTRRHLSWISYANCGVSQLTELAEGGNLHDQMKIARQHGDKMTPDDKLRIGYHVATAVADMHSIDGDEPSMSHNDLCCHQFMFLDGVYKLNDFHLASFNDNG